MNSADRGKLVTVFKTWGKRAVKRVDRLTRKHGVICSETVWSDGKRG